MKMTKMKGFFTETDKRITGLNKFQKVRAFVDFGLDNLFYGVPMTDYFKYDFYHQNHVGRKRYVTGRKKRAFYSLCNDLDERKYLDDKALFIKKYSEFTGRDAIDMMDVSLDDFKRFTMKHDRLFVKPSSGRFGLGAQVIDMKGGEDAESIYKRLRGKPYLVEQVLTQAPEMAAFNQSSVNTIRVVTFIKADGKPIIMPEATLLRIGRKGGIADNFHHGGIGALADNDTGLVITSGIDQNGTRWVIHPDSGKPIVGFKIPMWDEICLFVKEAAMVCPKVRCVGWDIAITEAHKIVLIEGNGRPDPDLAQMADRTGKWHLYKKLYDEIRNMKN